MSIILVNMVGTSRKLILSSFSVYISSQIPTLNLRYIISY